MRSKLLRAVLPLAVVMGLARAAAASEPFPAAVAESVPTLTCVPQCTLCHNQIPGLPPANKPFALKLKAGAAITPRDTASLKTALQKLKEAGPASDADGDGIGDYAELEAGSDPNSADMKATLCVVSPLYGCGASVAGSSRSRALDPLAASAAALCAFAGLMVVRRRRRRSDVVK